MDIGFREVYLNKMIIKLLNEIKNLLEKYDKTMSIFDLSTAIELKEEKI